MSVIGETHNKIWRKIYPAWKLPQRLKQELSYSELRQLQLSRDDLYAYSLYFFDHFLPEEIKAHRRYFSLEGRGYGEDSFHAMWYLLFKEFRPANALEIGVYRGQTITLWKLLARILGFSCAVNCISPFSPAGDSVSSYPEQVDYLEDTLKNHRHFSLPDPEICRQYSTDSEARDFVHQHSWQVIYMDGSHDYPIVCQDWDLCSQALASGGIIVLDDSSLYVDFHPPSFSFPGHPGPSRLAGEIPADQFEEVFSTGHNRVFLRKHPSL